METVEWPGPIIRVFGGAGLQVGGEPLSVGGPRQRRLLALLAFRAGEVVDNDWLSEYVWTDQGRPEATVPALRTYVSRLRSSFPEEIRDWIETEQAGYRLTAPDAALEHRAFTALRARARRARESGDPAAAERMLERALEMWRGEPFRELEDLDWAQAEIARLRLDRLEALEERWEVALALGRHTQITGELAAFISEHSLRERAVRQYALALHRSGRSTEALRVIDDHRRVVADMSGLDPSSELTDLEDGILSNDPTLDRSDEGTPLRGYRLIEQVGAGAFSVVWRAIQPSVERPVAVKQIREELAAQPDFIRRFELEAQTVARIEHPHVVPLIDFWRDPDAAYLVMRWLPGGTLERRLDDGPLSIDHALSIIDQVGRALAAAHSHDVIHRDVKSANVMFDEHGNAFLTDFGIALAAAESSGPEARLSVGSPAYASPEQLRREPLTPASDVFSLGVVLYECLVGSTPFSDSADAEQLLARQLDEAPPPLRGLRPDVSDRVDAAVARAMSKDPADRFASVMEFVDRLLSGSVTPPRGRDAPSAVTAENPYLGLRAFDQADAGRFFGRQRLVTELVERLSSEDISSRALMVVGPSGSGKSSVVRAGLLPAVSMGAISGSDDWFVTTMVPGPDPFESLEAALLRVAVNPPASLLHHLRDGPRGILRGVRRCLRGDDDTILVVVDQFEELFIGRASMSAKQFLDALAIAVEDPASPLRLVGTLRADFYHRPLEHQAFAPILKRGAVDVTPLAPDELEAAIVGPAELAGASFQSGLVARVSAEAAGQPSPLPLLQHLLAELFERRMGRLLTIDAYEDLGGLTGALAERAEEIFRSADDAQRSAIRRVFGRLTDPGEGSADLRRRVLRADLGVSHAVAWVLDRFGSARLLTFDRDPATRAPTVEVAHEALLREWPRLVEWLDEDRDLLRSLDSISTASAVWRESGQEADLLRGPRLTQALDIRSTAPERLRPLDRTFISASESLAGEEREAERRRARRLRRLNAAVSFALVVALIAGTVAFAQREDAVAARIDAEQAAESAEQSAEDALAAERDAETARAQAELGELISRSESFVDERPDLAVLLALEAHRRAPGPQAESAVLNALARAPGRVTSVALPAPENPCTEAYQDRLTLSADGITGFIELDGRLATIDLRSGEVEDRGPAPAPCVRWIGSEDQDLRWVTVTRLEASGGGFASGTATWTGSWNGPLEEIDLDRGGLVLDGGLAGDRILLSGSASDALLLDASAGTTVARIPTLGTIHGLGGTIHGDEVWAISDDGRHAVGGGAGNAGLAIVDGQTGDRVGLLELSAVPTAVSVRDGVALAGLRSGRVTAIDVASGEVLADVATTSASSILAIGMSDDGRVVAVAHDRIEVLDLAAGTVRSSLPIDVGSAVVLPDGRAVVFDVAGTSASVVDVGTSFLAERVVAVPGDAVVGFGSRRAALVLPTGAVEVIDLDTSARSIVASGAEMLEFEPIAAFPTHDGFVAFGGQSTIVEWHGGNVVRSEGLWDGEGIASFAPPAHFGLDAAHGPADASNGALVIFSSQPGVLTQGLVYLVGWANGVLETRLAVASLPATSAVASGDGGVTLASQFGLVRSYDSEGRWVAETTVPLRQPVVAAGSDGLVAFSGLGGLAILDPLEEGSSVLIGGLGTIVGMTFVDRGGLVTVESEGTVRLWDAVTGGSIGVLVDGGGSTPPSTPWFDSDRGTVWVASSGRLIEISLDPARWIDKACEFVERDLTRDEWNRYVPGDEPPRSTCP